MPVGSALESQGYKRYHAVGSYNGTQRRLQEYINQIGPQTINFAYGVEPDKVSLSDSVTRFVDAQKSQVTVIKSGYTINLAGEVTPIKNQISTTVVPAHAHGGCYDYGPVAEHYARLLHQGLNLQA